MNKKQIQDIAKECITFVIITPKYESPSLNLDKIDFIGDAILKITQDSRTDMYIQTKDIIAIKGVR